MTQTFLFWSFGDVFLDSETTVSLKHTSNRLVTAEGSATFFAFPRKNAGSRENRRFLHPGNSVQKRDAPNSSPTQYLGNLDPQMFSISLEDSSPCVTLLQVVRGSGGRLRKCHSKIQFRKGKKNGW